MTYINPGKKDNIYIGKVVQNSICCGHSETLSTLLMVANLRVLLIMKRAFPEGLIKDFRLRGFTIFSRRTSSMYGIEIFPNFRVCVRYARMLVCWRKE